MRFNSKCYSRQPSRLAQVSLIMVVVLAFSYILLENIHYQESGDSSGLLKEAIFQRNERDGNGLVEGEQQCAGFGVPGFENRIPELKVGKVRYDNKRLLRIYDFHYTGNDWESLINQYDVCFSTQTSIERIYWLPYVLENWTGPLSLAVYLTSEEEWLILNLYMCYLARCYASYQSRISMHLAVPTNITRKLSVDESVLNQWNSINFSQVHMKRETCPEPKAYLNFLLRTFPTIARWKLKLKEVYPQNHMRNIARKACIGWTVSADIDIIPRDGMANTLQEFYESRKDFPCNKCAYVIPTFEVNETFPFPESKLDLVELYKIGAARQFHGKYYSPGHKATDYKKWTSTNLEDGPVFISHGILLNETFLYEPFYISNDNIPPFDERFLGYGFTRNSQYKAASSAGWNFSVLTPVFSIHWGLQTASTVLSPKKDGIGKNVRKEQTQENSKLYKKILEELQLKKKLDIF